MLNDLKRGFSIHFKAKTNYGKIYTETALASKSDVKNDFYDKLRAYVQPVDMNLQQWSAKVSIKCEEKWYQYAKKYAEQAKIEAESAPVLPAEEKLERKWQCTNAKRRKATSASTHLRVYRPRACLKRRARCLRKRPSQCLHVLLCCNDSSCGG